MVAAGAAGSPSTSSRRASTPAHSASSAPASTSRSAQRGRVAVPGSSPSTSNSLSRASPNAWPVRVPGTSAIDEDEQPAFEHRLHEAEQVGPDLVLGTVEVTGDLRQRRRDRLLPPEHLGHPARR